MIHSITIPKGFFKKSTNLILNSNKLKSTINLKGNKIIYKTEDGEFIKNILIKNLIPFK